MMIRMRRLLFIALAGLGVAESSDALRMLRVAMQESEIEEPSLIDAVMQRARVIAREILAGRTSPHDGAKAIWKLSILD